ncbi:type VI secretion system Vgr family protein [Fuerstiella marisgermanici]|uniref:Type VI secretion system Vgr family protein n=1 Tax=Fuerstiella marisgermanici TaxID=1891926 RepID=A0A1P8WJ10_9PLAN|nr:type VI secretion system tip protein TssI/VgrG [Fuerstiella marisgermanici]APZ94049.1 type VI secretion system Vgr family protein [Fuerstiella marisgermanici]
MAEMNQGDRPIGVETPLGKDAVVLTSFAGEERISGLFDFELQLMSNRGDIEPAEIVGHKVDFYVRFPDGKPRYFNGHVNRFAYTGEGDRAHVYNATVVPWMWFLTKGSDCKVHETGTQQNAQDIIDGLLSGLGFTDYSWDLNRTPEKRDYCVQYRETHYEFVTRLLAEEGIYFYFKHEQGKHELVMTDHVNGVFDCEDADVRLLSKLSQPELTDNLSSWHHEYEFTTGKFAHKDYDFEKPSTDLLVSKDTLVKLPDIDRNEIYDHFGGYMAKAVGDELAKLRMEEQESGFNSVTGSSECRSFSPGGRFAMAAHHNSGERGGKWVLTAVQHTADQGGHYFSGGSHSDEIYTNKFRCIPADVVFRPPYQAKPRVHGIQSAVVVGPPGDEIYTDEYGRIKVQFQWDRLGKKDDKSSFWVRVMTPWAGNNWGMVHIPRIGHEVIIDFLDGDPDRPVMTGMVYNKENMPPYGLPDNMTQSGIKTRSSKGGSGANYNEIRFEDKKDSEEICIHAEKDLNQTVENNRTVTVGNNETHKVGFDVQDPGDQSLEVYNDQTIKIGHGSGKGGQKVEIYEDRDVTIEKGDDLLVIKSGDQKVTLDKGDQIITVSAGDQKFTVEGDQITKVNADQIITVKGDQKVTVTAGDLITKVSAGKSETTAATSLELKCGASSIKLTPAGITIKGVKVDVEGTASVGLSAPKIDVNADGILTLKGSMAKINS